MFLLFSLIGVDLRGWVGIVCCCAWTDWCLLSGWIWEGGRGLCAAVLELTDVSFPGGFERVGGDCVLLCLNWLMSPFRVDLRGWAGDCLLLWLNWLMCPFRVDLRGWAGDCLLLWLNWLMCPFRVDLRGWAGIVCCCGWTDWCVHSGWIWEGGEGGLCAAVVEMTDVSLAGKERATNGTIT